MHTPNPNGISVIENTTTPVFTGVFSVILAKCPFKIWFPYKYVCSPFGLTQTLYFAYLARISRHVILSLNFYVFVNLPKHVPAETNSSLPICDAIFKTSVFI